MLSIRDVGGDAGVEFFRHSATNSDLHAHLYAHSYADVYIYADHDEHADPNSY